MSIAAGSSVTATRPIGLLVLRRPCGVGRHHGGGLLVRRRDSILHATAGGLRARSRHLLAAAIPFADHIAGGSLALLLGPINLWLGETRRRLPWHKNLGFGYMAGVLVGAAAAFYLSVTTPLGWIFGSGLFALAVAWTLTTGMAFRAIRAGRSSSTASG